MILRVSEVLNRSVDSLLCDDQSGFSEVPTPSQRSNSDILRAVVESVEESLSEVKIKLEPSKKAEVISLLYDYFTETNKAVDREKVREYLRLAA